MASIKLPVAAAVLPRGQRFTALLKGADLYMEVRPSAALTIECQDGETVEATVEAVQIGPLLNFLNPGMLGQPQHYANMGGQDARAVVDALEALYPKGKDATDPRTIYSHVTLALPLPAPIVPSFAVA